MNFFKRFMNVVKLIYCVYNKNTFKKLDITIYMFNRK